MARVAIPVTDVPAAGVAQPAQVAGDSVNGMIVDLAGGEVLLEAVNTDAAAHTVTVQTPGTIEGVAVADVGPDNLNANAGKVYRLTPHLFAQKSGADAGKVYVDTNSNLVKFRAYRA